MKLHQILTNNIQTDDNQIAFLPFLVAEQQAILDYLDRFDLPRNALLFAMTTQLDLLIEEALRIKMNTVFDLKVGDALKLNRVRQRKYLLPIMTDEVIERINDTVLANPDISHDFDRLIDPIDKPSGDSDNTPQFLFCGKWDAQPLKRDSCRKLVKGWATMIDLDDRFYSLHSLRLTYEYNQLKAHGVEATILDGCC